MRHPQNQYRAGEGSLRWGILWNRNWNVGGHPPSMRRFDLEQGHHEQFWNRILASKGYGDANRRVGLRDIGSDEDRFFLFVDRIDAKGLLINVARVPHHVINVSIAMPTQRGLGDEERRRRIPDQRADCRQIGVNPYLEAVFGGHTSEAPAW
jgi:hypothetical protein